MGFYLTPKEYLMKLFKLTTLTLMTVLSLTSCGDEKAENNLLLDMTMETLKIPLDIIKSSDQVTKEQKACIDKIDLNSQRPVIKDTLDKAFTKEELGQLNDFYAKPAVQKVTKYGREQLFKQMGLPIEETVEKPSEEDIKVITDFTKTEIGKKYDKFNTSEETTASNQKVNNFIKTELDKCGLGSEPESKE